MAPRATGSHSHGCIHARDERPSGDPGDPGGRTGTGRHIPIIGVTAHALDSDREACLAAGMDDYLSKPISPEILLRKIEEWGGLPVEAVAFAER